MTAKKSIKMASVTVIKSILLVVMAIATMMAVLLPFCVMGIPRIKNSNSARRRFILSFFNCFGGGVFIATGEIIMISAVFIRLLLFFRLKKRLMLC